MNDSIWYDVKEWMTLYDTTLKNDDSIWYDVKEWMNLYDTMLKNELTFFSGDQWFGFVRITRTNDEGNKTKCQKIHFFLKTKFSEFFKRF
jgi:hypothetical protein